VREKSPLLYNGTRWRCSGKRLTPRISSLRHFLQTSALSRSGERGSDLHRGSSAQPLAPNLSPRLSSVIIQSLHRVHFPYTSQIGVRFIVLSLPWVRRRYARCCNPTAPPFSSYGPWRLAKQSVHPYFLHQASQHWAIIAPADSPRLHCISVVSSFRSLSLVSSLRLSFQGSDALPLDTCALTRHVTRNGNNVNATTYFESTDRACTDRVSTPTIPSRPLSDSAGWSWEGNGMPSVRARSYRAVGPPDPWK
jgi:hypothetical protein